MCIQGGLPACITAWRRMAVRCNCITSLVQLPELRDLFVFTTGALRCIKAVAHVSSCHTQLLSMILSDGLCAEKHTPTKVGSLHVANFLRRNAGKDTNSIS